MLVRESISFERYKDPKVALGLRNEYEQIMYNILKAKGIENKQLAINEFKKHLTFYFNAYRIFDITSERNIMYNGEKEQRPQEYEIKIFKYKTFLKIEVKFKERYATWGADKYYITVDLLNPYIGIFEDKLAMNQGQSSGEYEFDIDKNVPFEHISKRMAGEYNVS